jgi:hypothetical protein
VISLEGAERIDGMDGDGFRFAGWRLPDGRIALELAGERFLFGPEDRIEIEFGGLSAAVGVCPVGFSVVTDGARRGAGRDVDFDVTDESPEALRDELLRRLEPIARAAGCMLLE